MNRAFRSCVLSIHTALILAALSAGCRTAFTPIRPLVRETVTLGASSMPYAVSLPPGYSVRKQWPVILFLHGANQRGEDGLSQCRIGIGPALQEYPERFPSVVVMPQMPRRFVRWCGVVNELALKSLADTVRKYHGDGRRLYLTGCSMGGCGCWRMAATHPRLFAAVVPICSRGTPAVQAPLLARLPIWVFHGAADHLMPVQGSRAMVQAIRAAGSTKIRYTEYPREGHTCWNRVYSDPSVISWLLSQKR